jgi:hypothetical protein
MRHTLKLIALFCLSIHFSTSGQIPSSAERARLEQLKAAAKQPQEASNTDAKSGTINGWPQIQPIGPKQYAPAEVMYKSSQQCRGAKTKPDNRYVIDLQKEVVLDTQTKLMWKRCAEGLAGEYCELYAPHNSKEKLQNDNHRKWTHMKAETLNFAGLTGAQYRNSNFAGYNGWRIPTIEEFKTLLEENCQAPAMNDKAFPSGTWGTASYPGDYWTSSLEYVQSDGFRMTYSFSFAGEGTVFNKNYPDSKQSHSAGIPVRLVRQHYGHSPLPKDQDDQLQAVVKAGLNGRYAQDCSKPVNPRDENSSTIAYHVSEGRMVRRDYNGQGEIGHFFEAVFQSAELLDAQTSAARYPSKDHAFVKEGMRLAKLHTYIPTEVNGKKLNLRYDRILAVYPNRIQTVDLRREASPDEIKAKPALRNGVVFVENGIELDEKTGQKVAPVKAYNRCSL